MTEKNDFSSWDCLFAFSSCCFAVSKRRGQRRSLAAAVNKQLVDELAPAPQGQPLHRNSGSKSQSSPDPLTSLAEIMSSSWKMVTTRVPFVLLALRIPLLQLMLTPYPHSRRSILQLTQIPFFPSVPEMSEAFAHITEKEVTMGIKSFPYGSAGGPDGLRPQHLKDLTSDSVERGGRELLSALTTIFIVQGNAPLCVHPILFGATLIALHNKEGGIRPISIGLTLRHLAAKIVFFSCGSVC